MNYIFWIKCIIKFIYFDLTRIKKWYFDSSYFSTRSACTRYYTGKCMFESHFLDLFFIEIYLIIFNSYDIIMKRYMHTTIALCVLNDYIFFYKVIFIIYSPLIANPGPHRCELMQSRTWLCHDGTYQNSVLVVHIWAYSFILTWIGNWMFFRGTCLNIYITSL